MKSLFNLPTQAILLHYIKEGRSLEQLSILSTTNYKKMLRSWSIHYGYNTSVSPADILSEILFEILGYMYNSYKP